MILIDRTSRLLRLTTARRRVKMKSIRRGHASRASSSTSTYLSVSPPRKACEVDLEANHHLPTRAVDHNCLSKRVQKCHDGALHSAPTKQTQQWTAGRNELFGCGHSEQQHPTHGHSAHRPGCMRASPCALDCRWRPAHRSITVARSSTQPAQTRPDAPSRPCALRVPPLRQSACPVEHCWQVPHRAVQRCYTRGRQRCRRLACAGAAS